MPVLIMKKVKLHPAILAVLFITAFSLTSAFKITHGDGFVTIKPSPHVPPEMAPTPPGAAVDGDDNGSGEHANEGVQKEHQQQQPQNQGSFVISHPMWLGSDPVGLVAEIYKQLWHRDAESKLGYWFISMGGRQSRGLVTAINTFLEKHPELGRLGSKPEEGLHWHQFPTPRLNLHLDDGKGKE